MRSRRRMLLSAVAVGILLIMSWLVLEWVQKEEPTYQGQPLSFWLQGYDSGNYNLTHPKGPLPPTWEEAEKAIHQIGTNAIPALLRMLQQRDSKFKWMIVTRLPRQHLVNFPFIRLNRNFKAFQAFDALGPEANNAVPRLMEIFNGDPSPFVQQAVPVILGHVGPAASLAIPSLLRGITHTNSIVRDNAVFALRKIRAAPSSVVPMLIKCLNDPDILVRAQAARALGAYGKQAEPAVPVLLELLRKEPPRPPSGGIVFTDGWIVGSTWIIPPIGLGMGAPDVGDLTRQALQSIDPETAAKAGVK